MDMQAPHHQALSKAKIALMQRPDSVFFTTVLFSLKHKWDETCPTAYTDGKTLGFNPDFFMQLDQEERVFVLIHEAMHCAYLHMERLGERDRRKWNIAADHVINLQLIERGFKMPVMGLADEQYRGMGTEEVYKALPENPPPPPMDDLREPPHGSEELQKEIEDILVRAQVASKMAGDKAGTIPGDIEIFLDRLLDPKLPWNRILQKYLHSFAKNDYSWRRPNKRYFPQFHLPSLYSTNLIDLAIAVDASGSVEDEEFRQFVTETASILKMMKPENITMIQFDTEIKGVDRIRNVRELMNVSFTGRGGTRIAPVLEWAEQHKPQAMLIFTDGEFRFHNRNSCRTDIVWLIHNNKAFTAPFGKVIHYDI